MKRYTPELCSKFEPLQVIKTVGATGTPEKLWSGIAQVFTVKAVADVDGSLAGTYFDAPINDRGAIARFWFTVDNEGAAPAQPVNGRLVKINVDADDSANDVALATKLVVDADADLNASVLSDTVTVTQAKKGVRGLPSEGTSGFDVTETTAGRSATMLVPSFSLTGKKGLRTANAGTVYFGFGSANDTQGEEIATGKTVVIKAPEGAVIDLTKIWIDVATNDDGVLLSVPAVERPS